MKLRLPQQLIEALVTVTPALVTTISGISGVAQAYSGDWAWDNNNVWIRNTITEIESVNNTDSGRPLNFSIFADGENGEGGQQATIHNLALQTGSTVNIATNIWETEAKHRHWNVLTIENLSYGDGAGNGNLHVAHSEAATIKSLAGSVNKLELEGSLTFDDGTFLVTYMEIGNLDNTSKKSKLELTSDAKLIITGEDEHGSGTAYKTAGTIFAEWNSGTDFVNHGTYLSQNAQMKYGDNTFTMNLEEGSITAVKGIKRVGKNPGQLVMNLKAGAKLILGSEGITTGGTQTVTFSGGTLGMSDSAATVGCAITLSDGTTTTIDTAQYTFADDGQSITQGTEGGELTISQAISGSGALKKTGNGTLILSSANTFTGGTTIEGGILKLNKEDGGQAGQLKGTVTVKDGGILELAGNDSLGWGTAAVNTLNIEQGGKLNISAAGARSGGGQFNQTFQKMTINLTGAVVTGEQGATVDLFNNNNVAGNFTTIVTKAASDATAANPTISTVDSNVTLKLRQSSTTIEVQDNAKLNIANGFGTTGGAGRALVKNGAGTLSIGGASSYTGGTTINGGTLEIGNVNALGSGAVTGSGTLAYKGSSIGNFGASFADTWTGTVSFDDVAMQGNLSLSQFGNATSTIYLRAVRGSGSGVVLQGGTVNSAVRVENSTLAAFEGKIANGAELTFNGSFSGSGSGTDGGNLRFSVVDNGTASITFAGDVSGWKSSRDSWSGLHVDAGTLNTIFTAANTTVNAHLTKENANKLNVIVGDGTNASNVTFTQKLGLTSLTVKSGSTAKVLATEDKAFGNVSLTDSSLLLRADSGTRTFAMDSLSVSGNGTINIEESNTGGQGWHATVNIGSLSNAAEEAATVKLGNAARAYDSIYNINGGSFAGEIIVNGTATTSGQGGAARRMAVQINSADVAKNSVITFDNASGQEAKNKLGLGIGADVSVKGIQHAAGSSVNATIYSGKITDTAHNSDFASIGSEKHTITITGDGNYETSAKIDANLNIQMSGSGTQTFSGNMSNFNGDITANDGSLVLKNLGSAASFNLNNLTVKDGATVSGYTGAAIDAAQEATINVAGTLTAESGANLNANLTFSQGAKINVAGENGLHMGSTVTFTEGNGLLLTGNASDTLASFRLAGESLTLFSGVDTFVAGNTRYTTDSVTLAVSDYFNLADSKYDFVREHLVLKYQANTASDGGTISLWMETPEPATATLSLLALAALAARRKRH